MKIKRLRPGDESTARDAVSSIKSGGDNKNGYDISTTWLKNLLARDDIYFIAAMGNGKPTGFLIAYRLPRIDCDKDMVLLYEIEISEAYRVQGLGKRLISELKNLIGDHDIMKMWVITNKSNEAAMKLYQSTGGTPKSDNDIAIFDYRF